mmetsp:Transcript_29343/g.95614  ORF Transcript_29343/g.95614 Transcript_29343/m.95614 type:complete len:250 (-) Transcript_29343:351-1100(-)
MGGASGEDEVAVGLARGSLVALKDVRDGVEKTLMELVHIGSGEVAHLCGVGLDWRPDQERDRAPVWNGEQPSTPVRAERHLRLSAELLHHPERVSPRRIDGGVADAVARQERPPRAQRELREPFPLGQDNNFIPRARAEDARNPVRHDADRRPRSERPLERRRRRVHEPEQTDEPQQRHVKNDPRRDADEAVRGKKVHRRNAEQVGDGEDAVRGGNSDERTASSRLVLGVAVPNDAHGKVTKQTSADVR